MWSQVWKMFSTWDIWLVNTPLVYQYQALDLNQNQHQQNTLVEEIFSIFSSQSFFYLFLVFLILCLHTFPSHGVQGLHLLFILLVYLLSLIVKNLYHFLFSSSSVLSGWKSFHIPLALLCFCSFSHSFFLGFGFKLRYLVSFPLPLLLLYPST